MSRKAVPSPRKQPSQARSRQTVEVILAATSRILAREGYEAATTTRVAEVAGVSIGSLYQYFPSKEALVSALVEAHIGKIIQLLADATSELTRSSLDEVVRALARALVRAQNGDPELHAVLTQHFPDVEGFRQVRTLNARACELVQMFLAAQPAVRPQNLSLAAFVLVHAVQAIISAAVVERSKAWSEDELVDALATLVLRFLAKS